MGGIFIGKVFLSLRALVSLGDTCPRLICFLSDAPCSFWPSSRKCSCWWSGIRKGTPKRCQSWNAWSSSSGISFARHSTSSAWSQKYRISVCCSTCLCSQPFSTLSNSNITKINYQSQYNTNTQPFPMKLMINKMVHTMTMPMPDIILHFFIQHQTHATPQPPDHIREPPSVKPIYPFLLPDLLIRVDPAIIILLIQIPSTLHH